MRCRDCPYAQEDFQKYKSYADEEDIEQFVWCDKVGGKVYYFGHCSDCYEQDKENQKVCPTKKRINKRERHLKHQNHLKYLERVSCGYPKPVTYEDEIWIKGLGYVENPKPYYKRWYRGKRSKHLKQWSNRKIRRYKGELHNGNSCHKLHDFWWNYI